MEFSKPPCQFKKISMSNNHLPSILPTEMHEHGNPKYRDAVPPEPFPCILRLKIRYASTVGLTNIRTFTTYGLGDCPPSPEIISSTPLRQLDPNLDKPLVLMIMTHPIGTDPHVLSSAMQTMSSWRGSGMKPIVDWSIGKDRMWTLHKFDPIPGTHSHIIVRKGFKMTSIEGLEGAIENSIYEREIARYREAQAQGVHWHRHYASDAPVPGTALHSPDRSTKQQMADWFSKRLSVPLPDGTEQTVLATEVVLKDVGGVAYSAIKRGPHIMAHRCDFAFSLNDEFNDTVTWIASYELSGWDETDFPPRLAAMLTSPASPGSAHWRQRADLS